MLIVFDSKSSLTHYTFDKIKFLSQLHICIALLNILFLKIYVQNLTWCSWKLGFRGIIFSARKLRECMILHHLPQSFLNRFEYTSFWGSYAPVLKWWPLNSLKLFVSLFQYVFNNKNKYITEFSSVLNAVHNIYRTLLFLFYAVFVFKFWHCCLVLYQSEWYVV